MGVQITELMEKKEIDFSFLKGKVIAIDTSLFLYQFLTTIRQRDGTPLMDSKGNITSHLVGLFSRTINLMQKGVKLCYVLDGTPPKLKTQERERRKELKIEAEKKYKIAIEKQDLEEMKKYASRTSRLTKEMIEDAKKLISAFGLPLVQGKAEGEAQAAYLVKQKDAYAVASQDADSLVFGSLRLVRNLSIAGRRKQLNRLSYEIIRPELIELSSLLNNLGIDEEQLIVLAMLVGTDYNPGGIKGIGPKNALKLVKSYNKNFDKLFNDVKWNDYFSFSWKEVFELFKNPKVNEHYNLEWKAINEEKIKKLLVEQHDFSEERVSASLEKLKKIMHEQEQKGLSDFF